MAGPQSAPPERIRHSQADPVRVGADFSSLWFSKGLGLLSYDKYGRLKEKVIGNESSYDRENRL